MLLDFNDSILELVDGLESDISWRLNNSGRLISDVIIIANYIKDLLLKYNKNIFQKIKIIRESRLMLRTFEIGLKYIPQIYFETLKLLRYSWYNYEANVVIA
jgi:hypothetical protein